MKKQKDAFEQEQKKEYIQKKSMLLQILRGCLSVIIVSLAALFYFSWLRESGEDAVPDVVTPQPYIYEEQQKVRMLLFWDERLVYSPIPSGQLQLVNGGSSHIVSRQETIASVINHGKVLPVSAPQRGYFVPAVDGYEKIWKYNRIWPGSALLPEAPKAEAVGSMMPLRKDRIIGKIIALPAKPRAVFYADLTENLEHLLSRGKVMLRSESKGIQWETHVRVFHRFDAHKVKICVDMPLFPLEMTQSREVSMLLCSGEEHGLRVPLSAVVMKNATYGVYELLGDQLVFREVTGVPIADGMFFISGGLAHGNPVLLHAAGAKERRVQL